jgi:hypothetical protein
MRRGCKRIKWQTVEVHSGAVLLNPLEVGSDVTLRYEVFESLFDYFYQAKSRVVTRRIPSSLK